MIAAPEPGGSGEPLTGLKFLYLVKGGYGQQGSRAIHISEYWKTQRAQTRLRNFKFDSAGKKITSQLLHLTTICYIKYLSTYNRSIIFKRSMVA